MKIRHLIPILTTALLAASCAVSGGQNPDGSQWFFASVLENTAEEVRTVDERGLMEGKIGKDQTTGAKVVQRGILMREGIREGAAVLRDHIAKNRSVEGAVIRGQGELDVLRETNRSAETLQAAELAAEAAAGP